MYEAIPVFEKRGRNDPDSPLLKQLSVMHNALAAKWELSTQKGVCVRDEWRIREAPLNLAITALSLGRRKRIETLMLQAVVPAERRGRTTLPGYIGPAIDKL